MGRVPSAALNLQVLQFKRFYSFCVSMFSGMKSSKSQLKTLMSTSHLGSERCRTAAAGASPAGPATGAKRRTARPRACTAPASAAKNASKWLIGGERAKLAICCAKFCNFLAGSFSAVSKRNFARKYAFDSIFQALQDLHPFAPLQSQNFRKKSV